MDIWIIAVFVVLLTTIWRLFSSWSESRNIPAAEPYQVGGLTARSLELYNGYDFLKPILVAVEGVLYDVTDLRALYGPGKHDHTMPTRHRSHTSPHRLVPDGAAHYVPRQQLPCMIVIANRRSIAPAYPRPQLLHSTASPSQRHLASPTSTFFVNRRSY